MWHFDLFGLRTVYGRDAPQGLTAAMILLTLSGGVLRDALIASLLMVRRTRRVACSLGAVLVASGLLTTALKYAVGRRRPPYLLPDVRALWGAPTTPSFPSGHATAAFALAAFLVSFWNKRASSPWGLVGSVLLSVWAAGVAISRVFLGVHFPSDAIGGAVLGTLTGLLGARMCSASRARRSMKVHGTARDA